MISILEILNELKVDLFWDEGIVLPQNSFSSGQKPKKRIATVKTANNITVLFHIARTSNRHLYPTLPIITY